MALLDYVWRGRGRERTAVPTAAAVPYGVTTVPTRACEFLQCTVLGKHGAVSDDVTLRGRDVIFFLKQAKIILRCRYAPDMPRPGVSK